MAIQRLPAAYRSRSRPSSTPGAKASTMCPSYLDGDHAPDRHGKPAPRGELVSRTRGDTRLLAWLCSFQGPQRGARPGWALGLSKLNSMQRRRRVADAARSGRHARSRSSTTTRYAPAGRTTAPFLELPRKEVIQPHLPVRLPCYDFTPVTSPTFDGSLPEG